MIFEYIFYNIEHNKLTHQFHFSLSFEKKDSYEIKW